ncbi:hypothetical protein NH8B_0062 [Pseudogulbenkiania sp. NH8B]|nr:hypothetical protein NH8B_0062 [Pseudogulbenkiania sp. NH8B]
MLGGGFGQRVGGGACNPVEPPTGRAWSSRYYQAPRGSRPSGGGIPFGQPFMYQIMRKRLSARQPGAVPLNGG